MEISPLGRCWWGDSTDLRCAQAKAGGCTCAACVCERHKHSHKAEIPPLNSTKVGPASTASPPPRGETNKKRERKRKGPIWSTKRKENIRLVHCFIPFSSRLKGELQMREEEGSENKTAAPTCQRDLLIKPVLPHTIHSSDTVGAATPQLHATKPAREGDLHAHAVLTEQPGGQDSSESDRQVTTLLQTIRHSKGPKLIIVHIRYQ